jgi:hypothetical protein
MLKKRPTTSKLVIPAVSEVESQNHKVLMLHVDIKAAK